MENFLAHWGYLALFAATLISSLGIPIGSEIAIGYAGALASGQLTDAHARHHLTLVLVIVVALLGEVVGSLIGYGIGRFGGRPLVDRVGKYVLLTHRDLDKAEAWFARRGDTFVFFGRFIPLLRSWVSLAAGLGEMAIGRFLVFTVIACAMWCAALSSIGYALGASWHHVLNGFSYAGYVAAGLFVVLVVVLILHRLSVMREERAAHSPAAAARRAAPGGSDELT
jgi:membrane protein DedA with SNARE-associated domain